MNKSGIFKQLSVLSAGTFANILTAILFGAIMIGFFVLAFAPSGVQFNTYSYSYVNIQGIDSINGNFLDNASYSQILEMSNSDGYNEFKIENYTFLADKNFLIEQSENAEIGYLILYDNSPAINANLEGAITEFNGVKISDWKSLGNELNNYLPGDEVEIITTDDNYEIVLGENPSNSSKPWIGIGYQENSRKGFIGKFVNWISSFKKSEIYYTEKFVGAEFIYNLLWWLVLISFSVALVNMLPMGIFDGGKFFYLTILAITKKPKTAENWFKWITRFLLFLVILLMVFWVFGIAS